MHMHMHMHHVHRHHMHRHHMHIHIHIHIHIGADDLRAHRFFSAADGSHADGQGTGYRADGSHADGQGAAGGGQQDAGCGLQGTGWDWAALAAQRLPAPFVPQLSHSADTACFRSSDAFETLDDDGFVREPEYDHRAAEWDADF